VAKRVVVRGEEVEILVELFEEPTAEEMWARLPFESKVRTVRGQIVIPIPVPAAVQPGDRGDVGAGDAAYSPEENALCLFHEDGAVTDGGRLSRDALNRFGRVVSGLEGCGRIRTNETVRIEAAEG
jgi:hypothetical protein